MDVKQAIEIRRSYRALEKVAITEDIVNALAGTVQLTPSCFNNQPWRYVFVTDEGQLKALWTAYNRGNEWCRNASMVIAVATKKELDCIVKDRVYALFDTGMATGMLMLRATELGLVAHGIAGFDEQTVKGLLNIPEDLQVITLVFVGKKTMDIPKELTPQQRDVELVRPERKPLDQIVFRDRYKAV
jgi:nitroreductase